MGLERPRVVRPKAPPSAPKRGKKSADAALPSSSSSSSSSSLDTLISRFRASAMTSRQSKRDGQDGSDGDSVHSAPTDDQYAPDDGYGDDDSDFDFDASASLSPLSFSPARPILPPSTTSNARQLSPGRNRDSMKRAPGTAFFRSNNSKRGDGRAEEVSPMPKLTQQPRTKPSLLLKPKPSLLQRPKPVPRSIKPGDTRRASPANKERPATYPRLPESPPRRAVTVPRPCRVLQSNNKSDSDDDDELSSLSPPSSASDRADTPGSSSLGSMLGRDLADLRELLSSKKPGRDDSPRPRRPPVDVSVRSWTSDDITAVLRQSTRLRRDEVGQAGQDKASRASDASSFRLRLDKLPSPKRAAPLTSERGSNRVTVSSSNNEVEPGEESFVEELNVLGASLRQSQELDKIKKNKTKAKAKAAAAPTKRSDTLEISEATTATIRAASDAIDKALLLALQPFERRRQQQEQSDAVDAAAAAKAAEENSITSVASAELPVASQRIVEQLDLAFGELTQQRNAELKEAEDAEAAAKQAEEDKQKADADAKTAAEQAAREKEMEVLRLLPLHGKLLSCSMDIDEALVQLEASERWRQREAEQVALDEATTVADAIATLRSETERKIREIEAKATASERPRLETKAVGAEPSGSWSGSRPSELTREHFNVSTDPVPIDNALDDSAGIDQEDSTVDGDFHGVIQREVVQKLHLTMLKLRHVLSVDEKEAQEAAAEKQQQEETRRKQQEDKAVQEAKQRRELEDAEAARQRVMGLTSLDQVHEWMETHRQLTTTVSRDVDAVYASVTPSDSKRALWASEFDHEAEMQRFRRMERVMLARGGDWREGNGVSATRDDIQRPYPDLPERTHCGAFDADSDDEKLAQSCSSLSSFSVEPAYRASRRTTERIPVNRGREGPGMFDTHSIRRYRDGEVRRKAGTSTRTATASATGRRTGMERSIAATIQAFQSDRRAKAKWFKQSNGVS